MQSPWLFFTPNLPLTPHHHHGQCPSKAGGLPPPPSHGLIPLPMSPGPLLTPGGNPFGTYGPPQAHHHHSQLLLAAAAAAAYGQQCATLLHQQQHQQQLPRPPQMTNGNFHLKMDDGGGGGGVICPVKRKSVGEDPEHAVSREIKKAKLETKALKAKRPGFTDERYNETSYYVENGLRKVYPYYFTFTTFTKGRWVGEKILDVFAREFRAHPVEEYERCIKSGTLTVNYQKVETDYRLKHNDLLANIVHRHEVPVTSDSIEVIYQDEDLVVVNKPASIPVHPCGRYRHNTVVFILAKEHQLKNLRTIHRLDRLTSGLLLFGKSPKKAREMEHQIRNRLVQKEYVCRVEGNFPEGEIECLEPIEVVSYKIGVCKVSKDGKDCRTLFKKLSFNGRTSVVIARPRTGRMHQIRVHLQFLGYPIVNDPLYNHPVFGPEKGKGGITGKSDEALIAELISIHNAENWLGIEGEEGGGAGGGDFFGPSPLPIPTATAPLDHPSSSGTPTTEVGSLDEEDDSSDLNRDMNGTMPLHHTKEVAEHVNKEEKKELSPSSSSSSQPPAILTTRKEEEVGSTMSTSSMSGKVTVGTQTSEEDESSATTSPHVTSNLNQRNTQCSMTSSISTRMTEEESSPEKQEATSSSSSVPPAPPPGAGEGSTVRPELSIDPHCYECKVKYRDPKPKDLVMYLHALSYRGPGWVYETKHPAWAEVDWLDTEESPGTT